MTIKLTDKIEEARCFITLGGASSAADDVQAALGQTTAVYHGLNGQYVIGVGEYEYVQSITD